mgnify:CR=1 FL=1
MLQINWFPFAAALVLGVVGGIVLLGLILLVVWKIVMTIHDGREYAKFENESKNAQFNRVNMMMRERVSHTIIVSLSLDKMNFYCCRRGIPSTRIPSSSTRTRPSETNRSEDYGGGGGGG